jgi:hypothetical protein
MSNFGYFRSPRFWAGFLGLTLLFNVSMPFIYVLSRKYLGLPGFEGFDGAAMLLGGICLAAAVGLYTLCYRLLIAVYGADIVKTEGPAVWRTTAVFYVMMPVSVLVLFAEWYFVEWILTGVFPAGYHLDKGGFIVGLVPLLAVIELGPLLAACELAARGNKDDSANESEAG